MVVVLLNGHHPIRHGIDTVVADGECGVVVWMYLSTLDTSIISLNEYISPGSSKQTSPHIFYF